jgi:hypothetical protein
VTESVAQLEQAAHDEGFSFTELTPKERFVLFRRSRYMVLDEIHKGSRDVESIAEAVITKLKADPVVGSLVTIIAIAVLSGFIQWLIKRILDRWFPEVDDA